jgi:ribosomal protein L6P/L9E
MNPLQLLVVALIALPLTVFAHHGWSEYDATQTLKLTGTIEGSTYEHPHGSVTLKTPTKTWIVVRGLARDLLKVGATASVEGYPNRNKPEEMRAERITIAGKTVELR